MNNGFGWISAIGITVMLIVVFARSEGFQTKFASDDPRPVIWWYVDDVESNGRQWLDFGNRDTRDSNEPYLEICWERAQKLWGNEFRLERITGRKEMLQRIGMTRSFTWVDTCPPALWMPWCRATILSRFGGLWLDGSVLPFDSSSLLSRVAPHETLAFGTDSDAATGEEGCPGLSAGWARAPGDAVWTAQAHALADYIHRGAWTAFETDGGMRVLWSQTKTAVPIDRSAEISRDKYGRRLELETLLTETVWEGGAETRGAWVPWPRGRDELTRASPYGWFLRSSAEQIRNSDYVWARWARSETVPQRIQ